MRRTLEQLQAEIAGRYIVVRELGRGGMATVYLADDAVDRRQVAIKVLRREITGLFGSGRFNREIRILQRLKHPAIVPVLDAFESSSLHYYVMPYVAGDSLRVLLEREGALPLARVLHIAGGVAQALDYAHSQNVLHRDIKPANILLEGDRALVCDFGIARAMEVAAGDALSSSGLVLGTPAYMSPEQAMGETEIDARSDIYALGCLVYEMLTGEQPFGGPTSQVILARQISERPRAIGTVRPDLPPDLERAVFAALAKASHDRPPTAAAFLALLCGRA